MSCEVIDAASLVGCSVAGVFVGWHVLGADRTPTTLFIDLVGGERIEMHTAGDGSIQCIPTSGPDDFNMSEYGRFEHRPAHADHPAIALVGQRIRGVERVVWRGSDVGLRLILSNSAVVIANEGDEIFVSDGELPLDYRDATIG